MDLIFGVFFYNLSSKVVYIRNRSLQPCSLEYELASHTIYITREWRELYFKVFFDFRFLRNFLWKFLFTLSARNLLRGSRRRSILLYFVLPEMSDLGFEPRPHV